MGKMEENPLAIDPEEMRRIGYLAVDTIVRHLAALGDGPPNGPADRATMEALFAQPLPRTGVPMEDLIGRFAGEIIPHSLKVNHPRFFAYIPSSPVFPAMIGDFLAAGANTFAGTWLGSPAAAMIEITVLEWFREMLRLDPGTEGLLVSGGSVANLTSLAVARTEILGGRMEGAILYTSDQRHASIDRACALLGFGKAQLREIPSDDSFRLRCDLLEDAIREDRGRGLRPFCVIAHGGTTNTGAVDPLERAGEIARREGLWLHVDAAYGGFAAASEERRSLFRGLEQADSIVLDPHKWLFQPFEVGCVLTRHQGALARTFSGRPDYLREVPTGAEEVTFADRGVQLSRAFRALKIWMTIQHYGIPPILGAIDRACNLASLAADLLDRAGLEVIARPQLSVVAFRIPGADDARQNALIDAINRSERAFVSSTLLRGRITLRLCVLSPATTERDIAEAVDLIGRLAR